MKPYHLKMTQERRWRVLDFIQMVPARSLNTGVLRSLFREAGFPVDATDLEDDVAHLEKQHCVTVKRYVVEPAQYLNVVTLTPLGHQVWLCERAVDGVAARRPL